MKKRIALLLAVCLTVGMTACSGKNSSQEQAGNTETATVISESDSLPQPSETKAPDVTIQETLPDTDPWNETPEIFGVSVSVINTIEANTGCYDCNIPDGSTVREYGDHVYVKCESGHVILLGLSDSTYEETDNLDDAFEAFIPRMEVYLDEHHNVQAKEHKMTIKEQELVEIQNQEMMQVRGTITFVENKSHERSWAFLGYAVPLNTGNFAYFFAAYYNSDYIQTKRIATNMAHSFCEVMP